MMKVKNNAGFSLVEVVVAMAILASVIIPVCTGMMVAPKVNAKAEAMLRAKIAVSSAVETMMAKGYSEQLEENLESGNIRIYATQGDKPYYYNVVVTDTEGLVTVTTSVHAAVPAGEEGGDQ